MASDKQKVISAAALAAIAAAGVAALLTGDTAPATLPATAHLGESRLAQGPDGGIVYVAPYAQEDGGEGYVVLEQADAPCKRKRTAKRGASCHLVDGGEPGEYNRWPAAWMVGPHCEPVSCAVMAGEDADAEEEDRVRKAKRPGEVP